MKNIKRAVFAIICISISASCEKKNAGPTEQGASAGCQCVLYVKNVIGIPASTSTADAYGWGNTYPIPNYYEVSGVPRAGDIVVIGKGYQWGDAAAGHIGFVKSYSYTNGNLNILVHGSNQQNGLGKGAFDECGCKNVDDLDLVNITAADRLNGKLRIYRTNAPSYCSSFGIASTLTASLSQINAGTVTIGNNVTQNIDLTNSGNLGINVSSITLPQYFAVNTGAFTVPPNSSVTIAVVFSPAQAGVFSGNMVINSNAANTTLSVPVNGTGVQTVPPYSITSSPLPGVFVPCPSGAAYNGSGGCSSLSFNNGVVKCRLRNPAVQNGQLVFEIVKCDGSNFQSGLAYMKKGDVCGVPIPSGGVSYNGGNTITIYVPIDFFGMQTFTCVIDPDNYPANYRFAGGSITVTRN